MHRRERRPSTSARTVRAARSQRPADRYARGGIDWSRVPPGVWAILVIGAFVLVANLPSLTGYSHWNPLQTNSGLLASSTPGVLPGIPTIDPNVGYVTQALGRRAALEWSAGHVPWWNPYEGVGAPLAAGMQSAALFPLTMLMLLPKGLLYFHLILEFAGGVGAWFLLRRLALRNWLAIVGGAAFALNGTFAWFAHAPVNPVPFLPWLLAGIELAHASAKRGERGGWGLIAASLALSIYAGFPETAFVNGVLAAIWSIMRFVTLEARDRAPFAWRVAKGTVVGLLISAPITLAFLTYLADAAVGGHSGALGRSHLPPRDFAAALMPYLFGPIFAFGRQTFSRTLTMSWGQVGGYVTCALVFLAALGVLARHRRNERLVLGGWAIFAILTTYGIPVNIAYATSHLPGFRETAFFRYSPPSWELAVVVLAVIGLDAIVYDGAGRTRALAVAGACTALTLIAFWFAWPVARNLVPREEVDAFVWASLAWGLTSIAAIAAAVLFAQRSRAAVISAVLLLDVVVMFAVPQFSARRNVSADFAPVSFLQRNIGLSRFFTLGPIEPNYGSYWGIAQLNVNDLPVPRDWANHVRRLDRYAAPTGFTGMEHGRRRGTPSVASQLFDNISEYREMGVRYVLAPSRRPLPDEAGPLTPVFTSKTTHVYELDGAADYFSAEPKTCAVVAASRQEVSVNCLQAATIVRRELYMRGWEAWVDGRPVALRRAGELFQAVAVDQGRSTITFRYSPPGMRPALAAAAAGAAFLLVPWGSRRARRYVRRAGRWIREGGPPG